MYVSNIFSPFSHPPPSQDSRIWILCVIKKEYGFYYEEDCDKFCPTVAICDIICECIIIISLIFCVGKKVDFA